MRRTQTIKAQAHEFGELFEPSEAAEPILGGGVRGALLEWLTEIWAEDDLKAVGIEPRRRAIFDGPPGVGKTTLAHHLAARLGLKMLAVRPDRIIDCWVGSTGRNIGSLFQAAADGIDGEPLVLFIDEFDAIAAKRRESRQAADDHRNESVNTLLQRIEQFPGYLIAATNFSDRIDQAIWRRFDIHITLEMPGLPEAKRILERYLSPYGLPDWNLEQLAEAMNMASPALMRSFCEGLKRQLVLGPKLNLDMSKAAVVSRILAAVHPHPDLGRPRLWSHAGNDLAVNNLPWPLPKADEIAEAAAEQPEPSGENIVQLGKRK